MADEVQLQPQTYEDAAGLINGFVDDYSAQAAIVSNYTLNNQKYLADNEFDNPEYTPTADTIQRDGNELAFTAIQGNARSILKDLGPESGNKVWGAYLDNADASGFTENEIAGLKQVREMAAQFPIHPVNKQIFEMTLGGPTAPRKGRKRSLGAFQLTERPDGSMEAGILQSEAPVPADMKTLALDSDVDAKIAELEAEREAAMGEVEALRNQAPAAGRFDGESAQSMASDNAILKAMQRADDAEARIKRYQSPQGKRMYAIDQMDKVLRTEPYIDYFGQEFSINAFGETLDKGGLRMGASLLTTAKKGANLSARAQFKGVAGIAGALGADEFAEQLDEASGEVFQKREQGIRESQQGMEDWIEVEFPGMEKTRLADTFMGNVAAGITEEAVPMAISIAVTGGTSWVGKKVGSYAAKKTMGELVKKGTLNYVDNVVAPFMGALTSSTRDGVDGWMEAQRAGDAVLQDAGFDSVEAAVEAGNQEVADKARRIFDDSNKVFLGNIATTTGTEMLMMRAYLGRMGNKAAAQQDELTSKLLKEQSDRFWKDMGAAAGDAVGEGVTENIQGVLSRGWAKRYYDSHQEMFPKDEMTQEFAIGMIMGGVTSAALGRMNAAQAGRMLKKFERQEGRRQALKSFAEKTDALFQSEAAQNEAVEKLRAERGGDVEVVATKVLNDRINTLANEMDVTGGVAADTTVDEAAILSDVEGEQAEVGVDEDVQPVGDEQTAPAEQEPVETEPALNTVGEQRFLESQLIVPDDDPRVETGKSRKEHRGPAGEVNIVDQKDLAEILPEGTGAVFHETSLTSAKNIIRRVEAGPRGHGRIEVSDNIDLALGQSGKGYVLEFDPRQVNGEKSPPKPADEIAIGSEYTVNKTTKGSLMSIIAPNQKGVEAIKKIGGIGSRFDFNAITETERGLRIPRKKGRPITAPEAAPGARVVAPATTEANRTTLTLPSVGTVQEQKDRREAEQQRVAIERAQALSDGMDGMAEAVNPESPNPTGFVGNAIKYLSSLHDKGTSALDKVLGVKAGDFAKWVTRNGKEDFDSEGAQKRLTDGLRKFATTGVAPVKGMENEFKALGKLLEPVYRSMAAKSGLETTSAEARALNTLFLDDVLRSSERELKKGEVPATRPQFVRVPTKTGGEQKGFKERQHAESFRKNQRDPEGQRLQVEEKDGLFYVIRPVITPGLNHKIDLVNQEAQGRFVDVPPGKKVARPSPEEDVKAVVNAKGRILGVDVGKAYGKLPWVRNNDNRVDTDIELAKNIRVENMFRAKNQALAIRGVLDRMPFSISPGDSATPGRMEGVVARNGTDSTVWNDVFESVSRGEDKYEMSPAAREWILDYRETVMDLVSMMQEEGAELKFIQLEENGEIDWGRSGIPGYIPRKYDFEATDAASSGVSGGGPRTKRGFDYERKFDTAGEGVAAGARYDDPMDTLVQFAYEAYAKVADMRFGNDPAVIRDALEAQKAPTAKDKGTRYTVGGKQLKLKNKATAASLREAMEYRTEAAWVKKAIATTNFFKAPLAGVDLASPVVFGGPLFFDSPKAWFKAFGNSMEALFRDPQVIFDRYASRSDKRGAIAQLAEVGGMLGGDLGVAKGLRHDFWSKLSFGLTPKMADSMMAFFNMGVIHSWEAHTAGFTKDETGRVVSGATPEQLAGIASFGNSLLGRLDPVRAGIPRGITTAGKILLFSNSLTMGFLSLIGKAAFKGGTEGKLSRVALTKFITGSVMTYIGIALAAGLDWEEIKKRINPFEAGSKFLSLPITYANGRTAEYGVGGTVMAVLKALSASYVGIRNRLSGDSTKTSGDPAQTVWEPLFKFFGYRKSPGISLVRGVLMGENFLGQPVGWAEAIVDGVTPIFAQEHTAGWVSDMMGAVSENNMYRYLAAQLPVLDNIAANRPFIDDTATESQKFGEMMVSFFGANVYTAPQQRNMEIQRDRLARERHGVNYDELDPKLRGPITKEVEDRPIFKNRLQKVKDENLWSDAMRQAENYHLNAQKRIMGWMRDRGEAGLPLGGANGKNQQILQSLMIDLPPAPSKYSYKEKGIYEDKTHEIVLSRDEEKEYEKRLGMDVNELINILTDPQDPNGSKWLNATVEFQQGKLKKLISDLSKKNLREIVREGKKQPTKNANKTGQ